MVIVVQPGMKMHFVKYFQYKLLLVGVCVAQWPVYSTKLLPKVGSLINHVLIQLVKMISKPQMMNKKHCSRPHKN